MSIRPLSSPTNGPLELFPGSISPSSSSHISYMTNTGAPKINIRKCSPPVEPDTSNAMSSFNMSSRSRSGSLKMFRQRLQSLNSTTSNNFSLNHDKNNSISNSSGVHSSQMLNIAPSINSNFSPRSSLDIYSFNGSVDDLTSEPGPDYISKNIKSYNEVLLSYLQQQGLNINPLRLKQQKSSGRSGVLKFGHSSSDSIQTFITGNGQLLYLPHNPAKKKHRVEQGEDNGANPEQEDDEGDDDDSDDDTTHTSNPQQQERLPAANKKLHHNVASHTFGVIIKLSKEQTMNVMAKAKYFADASTRWVSGIYQESVKGKNKVTFREKYKISKDIDWDLDFENPDCYIPFKNNEDDEDEDEIPFDYGVDSDSNDAKNKPYSDTLICSANPTQTISSFELLNVKEYPNEIDPITGKDITEDESYFNSQDKHVKTLQPGYYIFILPVVYPLGTPESVATPLGQMKHHLNIQIERVPYMPSIAPPPSAFLSTSPHRHGKLDDLSYSMDHSNSQTHSNSVGSTSKSLFKKLGRRHSSASKDSGPSFLGSLVGGSKSDSTVYDFRYNLPSIRLPPSDATSTLNKSIYVNKVWNDALNYELLLPRKYIQLSPKFQGEPFLKQHNFLLQMKLIPLIKSLCLKRIRINIVEKITYISKDMKYEEDVGRVDRTGVKERTATLLEIKTKEKLKSTSAPALNTQIVKDCVDDNLLTSCYNNGEFSLNADNGNKKRNRSDSNGLKKVAKFLDSKSSSMTHLNSQKENKMSEDKEIAITNPVKLQCPLIFYANDPSGFIKNTHEGLARGSADINEIQENENNDVTSIFSVATHNTYEDTMANNSLNVTLSHNDEPIDSVTKSPYQSPLLSPRKGSVSNFSVKQSKEKPDESRLSEFSFYPDTTVHNVKVRHRLQIAFRISKPDDQVKSPDGEPKMHHYEVIVDTPIVFVSPFCVSDTMDLPSYDYAVKSSSLEGPYSHSGGLDFMFGKCNDEEKDIAEDLPSFDEALLQPCSPMLSGFTVASGLPESTNSFTMLSQSPMSSNYSLSPPVSSSILTTWGRRTSRADSAASFTNLDSLIQADISNLSLSGSSNIGPPSSVKKHSLEESFAKKDISRVNNMGQLTNMFNPKTFTHLPVTHEPASDFSQLSTSPKQIPNFSQPAQIPKELIPAERPGLEHIPSRSSLHFEEDLPSYQSVLDQDSAGGLENLGLLSNNSNTNSQEKLMDILDSAGSDVLGSCTQNQDTFDDGDIDSISLNTINNLNELNVTEANHIL